MSKFTLPYPPSINHAHWHTGNGKRVLKDSTRKFYDDAALIARTACARIIDGKVSLTLHIYCAAVNDDISNRIKVLEDSLQGIAYHDDKQVSELHIYRHEAAKPKRQNARVEVEVKAA